MTSTPIAALGRNLLLSSTALLISILAPAQVRSQPATGTQMLMSGGVERAYLLYVPAGYRGEPMPLVLNFHGSGGVPENQLATSAFGELADREGFVVAFPAGIFTNSVTARSWNANIEPGANDVAFARDIITDVGKKLRIDTARVYATGFSGGGRMSSRLACELADVLAAAAPVAGLQYPDGCVPARPIPIITFHGKADPVNHYELAEDSRPYWRMGVETALERWRAANGCADAAEISAAGPGTELRRWSDCSGDAEIAFYVSENDGHVWPPTASELIWAFFEQHRL